MLSEVKGHRERSGSDDHDAQRWNQDRKILLIKQTFWNDVGNRF